MNQTQENTQEKDEASEEAARRQIRQAFNRIDREIHLVFFVDRAREEDVFARATREVVRVFRQFTDKLVFREYFSDHEMAKKWDVQNTPCLMIDPEHYPIRWIGAPMGEEVRTFMEMLLRVGLKESNLSDASKKVLGRIDKPRKMKVFVSPTCPYCPQQAINAVKAVVERPGLISLEVIDIQCRPDLAKAYDAQSVPQTFADDILIGMGAQAEEVFASSLEKMEPQTIFIPESDAPLVQADLVIIGGGPAGLTAGIYSARSGLKTVVVERGVLGGQVATTPMVENYPGFTQIGGKTLADIMVSHALQYVQIFQGEEVVDIQPGEPMVVTTSRRRFETRRVLLATGATHRHLGVPGEDRFYGKGVSYCTTCDGPLFRGKKVVMVGGGNSAVTEALFLHNMGVDVTLIHRRDKLRAQEALAASLKESKVPVTWNAKVKEIQGKAGVESVVVENVKTGKTHKIAADGVFIAIGYSPAVELAKKTGIELTPEGYIKRDARHRTNIAGIYSAGDVEGGYKQIVTAAGQGSEAAMAIFEDLVNPYWKGENKPAKT
jgi:thioredoxin reductase (NADPH)